MTSLMQTSLTPPTPAQAAQAVARARQMFVRALGGWAGDALRLRRSGEHRFTWAIPHRKSWSKAA